MRLVLLLEEAVPLDAPHQMRRNALSTSLGFKTRIFPRKGASEPSKRCLHKTRLTSNFRSSPKRVRPYSCRILMTTKCSIAGGKIKTQAATPSSSAPPLEVAAYSCSCKPLRPTMSFFKIAPASKGSSLQIPLATQVASCCFLYSKASTQACQMRHR